MHYLMRGLQDSGFRASLARSLGDTTTGELQSAVICPTGASIASAWIPRSAVRAKASSALTGGSGAWGMSPSNECIRRAVVSEFSEVAANLAFVLLL